MIGDLELLEAVIGHSSFQRGQRTTDGKRAETVAMESGNWHGEVKELIRRIEYLDSVGQ